MQSTFYNTQLHSASHFNKRSVPSMQADNHRIEEVLLTFIHTYIHSIQAVGAKKIGEYNNILYKMIFPQSFKTNKS